MDFVVIRLLLDFGLLVLIWMVQLIIYPSFNYFEKDNLIRWHHKYTVRIGIVVMPLMIGQIAMSLMRVFTANTFCSVIDLTFVAGVWLSTFLQFVPMHNSISGGQIDARLVNKLIFSNWIRVFFWTSLFLFNLLVCFF